MKPFPGHFLFLLLPAALSAQGGLPRNYFRDPLGIPMSLAGNFGELRPNHFHMGLDIRTQDRERLPVYAAAPGYISRVRIEPFGYGRAVYIVHPNGFTTVYGHLSEFTPALAAFVKAKQYAEKTWKIEIEIPAGRFPVQKGSLIAYSGNTGGSQAPHLHFEIRQTAEDLNLNPLLFGFPIRDQNPPAIQRLAVYDRTRGIYEQRPRLIPVRKRGRRFFLDQRLITVNSPRISFGISAYDKQNGSASALGIYEARLFDAGQEVVGFRLRQMSYAWTKNVNGHIDYRTRSENGPYIQQLFRLQGYSPSVYFPDDGDGILDLGNGEIHPIRILVKDAYGNATVLRFGIQYRYRRHTLFPPGAPRFYPGTAFAQELAGCSFTLGPHALYDSARIPFDRLGSGQGISPVYRIGSKDIPIQDSILVSIRPIREMASPEQQKVVMRRKGHGGSEVRPVYWKQGKAIAVFNDFGDFELLLDGEAPQILPQGILEGQNLSGVSRISFQVRDNLEAYQHFSATLDGHWILFTQDKGRAFIYTFDEHCAPGPHELKLSVEDLAGNPGSLVFHFSR
jgi:hypothetical protein